MTVRRPEGLCLLHNQMYSDKQYYFMIASRYTITSSIVNYGDMKYSASTRNSH